MSTRYVRKRLRNVKLSEMNYICLQYETCGYCPLKEFCYSMAMKFKVSQNIYNHVVKIKYHINFKK